MLEYQKIKEVHVELSSHCNAMCPMCQRSYYGGRLVSHLKPTDISLEQFKKIFPQSFLRQLNHILFCGNLGDPILARDLLPILKYIREVNSSILLSVHTNGALHNASWWSELAQILSADRGYVCFAIDGLEDTHSIYRRNTKYSDVIENATAFIEAGGNARWYFLIFKHNQHQVEEAKLRAEQLGFRQFNARLSQRFRTSTQQPIEKSPIWDKNDKEIGFIEPATTGEFTAFFDSKEKYIEYLDETEIQCLAQKENSIYLSADRHLFPCCMIHTAYLKKNPKSLAVCQFSGFSKELFDINDLDTAQYSIEEILQSSFFQRLPELWMKEKTSLNKPVICSATCGKKSLNYAKDERKVF